METRPRISSREEGVWNGRTGQVGGKVNKRTYSQMESLIQTPDLIAGLDRDKAEGSGPKAKRSLESRPPISAR